MAMSTLKKVFWPRDRKGRLVSAVILITVVSFIGYEGYAFYSILTDDGMGTYYATRPSTGTYLPLSSSVLYKYPTEAIDRLLVVYLSGRRGLIELNFTFHNCIYEKAALVYADHGEFDGNSGTKVDLAVVTIELVDIVEDRIILDLNETITGSLYYDLYILVQPMAPPDAIGAYYTIQNATE